MTDPKSNCWVGTGEGREKGEQENNLKECEGMGKESPQDKGKVGKEGEQREKEVQRTGKGREKTKENNYYLPPLHENIRGWPPYLSDH